MSQETLSIFDVLPGQLLPVSKVVDTLSKMWQEKPEPNAEGEAVEFRASQMNLILHFGLRTTTEEALNTFNLAIAFAQKYPCRLIVLCPRGFDVNDKMLEGKLFSQCYIGETMRSMCCCEALILGYPTRVADFLANQVSIWLESDLPVYHWFHRVPAKRIDEIHMSFVKRCRRVIYDSCIEGPEHASINWVAPHHVKDLAWARLLPVRQSLGQFLSTFEPQALLSSLERIEIRSTHEKSGEAKNLMKWLKACLFECQAQVKTESDLVFKPIEGGVKESNALEIEWFFSHGKKHFNWCLKKNSSDADIRADFGTGAINMPMQVQLLSGEKALSEALFFA